MGAQVLPAEYREKARASRLRECFIWDWNKSPASSSKRLHRADGLVRARLELLLVRSGDATEPGMAPVHDVTLHMSGHTDHSRLPCQLRSDHQDRTDCQHRREPSRVRQERPQR